MQDLTEAYFSIYEDYDDLSEVKGYGGHVDPQTGKSSGLRSPSQQAHATHWDNKRRGKDVPDPRRSKFRSGGSKGSTTGYHQGEPPEDFAKRQDPGLAMTPAKRMETRANALEKRGQGKRANKIRSVLNRPNMQEDYVDEGRAFPGGPDLAHKFPLSDEEKKSAKSLGFAAKAMAERQASKSPTKSASKPPTTKPTSRKSRGTTNRSGDTWTASTDEQVDFYDLVLDYLLDEGYADTEENAISMMSAMSEDWIDSIVEAFVDPENDEAPSGRTPMQNIEDKSDKVRKKAIKGFENQMSKEYGGKWKYQER